MHKEKKMKLGMALYRINNVTAGRSRSDNGMSRTN